MESIGIHLGVSFCSMPCLNFLPALISSSDDTTFADRFTLYWRDSVMLSGIVITIITTVAAIFQGALFLALISACVTGIISFGAHYVRRYAELKEMEDQLKKLQAETENLSTLNNNLQKANAGYQEQNGVLSTLILQFQEQLQARAEELAETSRQFEEFKAGNQYLRETSDMLAKRRCELDQTADRLRSLLDQYNQIQGRLESAEERLRQTQEAIEKNSNRLEASANRFESLESFVQRLGQYVESLPASGDQPVALQVRALLSEVKA